MLGLSFFGLFPLLTTKDTFCPSSLDPPIKLWLSTVPSSALLYSYFIFPNKSPLSLSNFSAWVSFRPTTLGTGTFEFPLLTTTPTESPFLSFAPGLGVCVIILPSLTWLLYSCDLTTILSPVPLTAFCACSIVILTTLGTVTSSPLLPEKGLNPKYLAAITP